MMKKVVFFTGAGISKESGIATFRDGGGRWTLFDFLKCASREALESDPERVLEFYNGRRREVNLAHPNEAHLRIAEFQKEHGQVSLITQNIDDLHERAESGEVLHLHGQINQAKTMESGEVIEWFGDLSLDDLHHGEQLRPNVVLFDEDVTEYELAELVVFDADVLVVIGTSLSVYPAAGLVKAVGKHCEVIYLDPAEPAYTWHVPNYRHIKKSACEGIQEVIGILKGDQDAVAEGPRSPITMGEKPAELDTVSAS